MCTDSESIDLSRIFRSARSNSVKLKSYFPVSWFTTITFLGFFIKTVIVEFISFKLLIQVGLANFLAKD